MTGGDEIREKPRCSLKARLTRPFGHRIAAPAEAHERRTKSVQLSERPTYALRTPWSIPRHLIVVWSLLFVALLAASIWWSEAAGHNGYPPSDPLTPLWTGFCMTLLILSILGAILFHVIGAELPWLPAAVAVPAIYAGVLFSQYLIEYRLLEQGTESFVATISSDASEFKPPPWCLSWTNGKSTCRRKSKSGGVDCAPAGAEHASLFYCCEELDVPRWCLSSDDVCGQVWRRSTLPGAPYFYRPVQLSRRGFTPEMKGEELRVDRCSLTVFGDVVSKRTLE